MVDLAGPGGIPDWDDVVTLGGDGAVGAAPAGGDDGVVLLRDDEGAEDAIPARAVLQEDGSYVLPLLRPVTVKFRKPSSPEVREEKTEQLHLHRFTGMDMRAIGAASNGGALPMIMLARSSRIPEGRFGPIFDRMDGEDINDAIGIASRFLGSGKRTGR